VQSPDQISQHFLSAENGEKDNNRGGKKNKFLTCMELSLILDVYMTLKSLMSPDSSSIFQNSMSSSLVEAELARPSSSSKAPRSMSITSADAQKLSSMGGNSAVLKLSVSSALTATWFAPVVAAAVDSVAVEHVTPLLTLLDSPGDAAVNCDGASRSTSATACLAGVSFLRACFLLRPPLSASRSLFLRRVCHTFLMSLSVRPGSCAAIADHLLMTHHNIQLSAPGTRRTQQFFPPKNLNFLLLQKI
jgi:hypothetical protein